MNIGDLVIDQWGEMAIVLSQVGAINRWRIKYVSHGGISTAWEDSLYPIAPTETQKKVSKKT